MLTHWELVLRLLIAAGLGSLVGLERERLIWAAGLRTHMLVCVGSCLFMIVSAYAFSTVLSQHVILDPSRVAAQVVSGIGFLGAGSILLRGDFIRGLTTAASLWTVAAIGLAVGGGLYIEAVCATLIILIILAGIKPLEKWFQRRNQTLNIRLKVDSGRMSIDDIKAALSVRERRISRYICAPKPADAADEITLTIKRVSTQDMTDMVRKLRALPQVKEAEKI